MENSSSSAQNNTQTQDDNLKHSKISLPEEIVTDILSRLPVKPVFQSRCISKSFSSIVNDPHFVDAHLRQSSRLRPSIIVGRCDGVSLVQCSMAPYSEITVQDVTVPPDFHWPNSYIKMTEIVGSCNGLVVVVAGEFNKGCYLWNPATNQMDHNIPVKSRLPNSFFRSESWGFGYCAESRVYKVVRIACYNDTGDLFLNSPNNKFLVEVFAYQKDLAWRRLDFSKFNVLGIGHGVTINGVVYWRCPEDDDDKLLAFNLAKEEFALFVCPIPIMQIMMFKGLLAVCAQSGFNERSFDLWVLKDEHCCISNESSWKKVHTTTVEFVGDMAPVCLNDRYLLNQCLVKMENTSSWVYSCSLYDFECKEIMEIPGLSAGNWSDFHHYVESIVPLYGLDDDTSYNSSGRCDFDHCDEVLSDNDEDDKDESSNSDDEAADGGKNDNVIHFGCNDNNQE